MTHPDMLEWQYRQILIELDQLQRHGADPDCPCSQAGMGEFCLSKHAVALHGLAQETMAMAPEGEQAELARLAEEALEWHLKFKDALCRPEDTSGIVEWARKWRKEAIEPIYYACKTASAKKAPQPNPGAAKPAPAEAVAPVSQEPFIEAMARWQKMSPVERQPIVLRARMPSTLALKDWQSLTVVERDAITNAMPRVTLAARAAPAAKARPPRRVTYHKGSQESAVDAALRLNSDQVLYIYPTAEGFQIGRNVPPLTSHIRVTPSKRVMRYIYNAEKGGFDLTELPGPRFGKPVIPELAARLTPAVAVAVPLRVHEPSACSIEGIAQRLSFPPEREMVYALLLDKPSRKGRVLGVHQIGSGGLVSSPVSVAGLLMAAQGVGAKAAVLVHNHPSGEAEPSEEDVETTRRIQREARKHGFVITDHLIVANGTVRSMLPPKAAQEPKQEPKEQGPEPILATSPLVCVGRGREQRCFPAH